MLPILKMLSRATRALRNFPGNWTTPVVANAVQNFAQLVGDSSGAYTLTDVKAYKGKLYVTASNSSSAKETFFIFTMAAPSRCCSKNSTMTPSTTPASRL